MTGSSVATVISESSNTPSILRNLTAAGAALILAHVAINISPILLGAAADGLGLSRSRAGLLTTLELLAFGLAAFFMAPRVVHLPLRRMVLAAAVIVFLGNASAALLNGFTAVAAARMVAGLGCGILASSAYAVISVLPEAEKNYGRCFTALFCSSIVFYLTVPPFVERFLQRGAYGFIAIAALLLIPLLFLFPQRSAGGGGARARASLRDGKVLVLVCGAMLATFSDGLIWPMTERIGRSLGLPLERIGMVLALSVLLGIAGSLAAASMGRRFGTAKPLFVGLWGTAISGIVLTGAASPPIYVVAAVLKTLTFFLFLPYLMGLATSVDRSGRVSVLVGGLLPVGAGLGPFVGGVLADAFGFPMLGWVALAMVAVASVPLAIVLRDSGETGIEEAVEG